MRTINIIGDDCEARIRPVNYQYDYRQNVLLPYVSHICKVTPRPFRKYPKPVLTSDPEEPAFPTSPGVPVGPLHSEREDGLNKKKESNRYSIIWNFKVSPFYWSNRQFLS